MLRSCQALSYSPTISGLLALTQGVQYAQVVAVTGGNAVEAGVGVTVLVVAVATGTLEGTEQPSTLNLKPMLLCHSVGWIL